MTAAPARRKPRARRGRGVLTVVVGLFVASGIVRLGDEAGQAYATESEAEAVTAPDLSTCQVGGQTEALLAAFRSREERLTLREAQIADRMQALSVAENQISEKIVALQAAEASLAATLSIADSAAVSDIDRLTAVYESMKPADAARLFEEMPPQFAAGFVGRMQPEAAAAIMGGLQSTTAYSISVVLAGRNANAPKQ